MENWSGVEFDGLDFAAPVPLAALQEEFFGEAFWGKDASLTECEKLIRIIRQQYKSRVGDLTRENSPEIRRICQILEEKFGISTLTLRILQPKPFAAITGTLLSTEATLSAVMMSLMPNAYTITIGTIKPFSDLEAVESEGGIRFSKPVPVLCHVTGPLFFSPTVSGGVVMAIMLHEIGHNFFLMTNVRSKRALISVLRSVAGLADSLTVGLQALRVVTDPASWLWKIPLLITTADAAVQAITSFLPRLYNVGHSALSAVADQFERAASALLPEGVKKKLYDSLGSVSLTGSGSMLPASLIYGIVTIISTVMRLTRNAQTTSVIAMALMVVTFAMRILSSTIDFILGEHRADEVFADGFATRFGYGAEVAQFSKIFQSLSRSNEGPMVPMTPAGSGSFSTRCVRASLMISAITDPHPATALRAKLAADVMRAELGAGTVPPELEKGVRRAIERIDDIYAHMLKDMEGTKEGEVFEFNQVLVDYSNGKTTLSEVISSMVRLSRGAPKTVPPPAAPIAGPSNEGPSFPA